MYLLNWFVVWLVVRRLGLGFGGLVVASLVGCFGGLFLIGVLFV